MTKQKKKKAIVPFDRSNSTYVIISKEDFNEMLSFDNQCNNENVLSESIKLIKLLSTNRLLVQQIKDIKSMKNTIRSLFNASDIVFLKIALENLLYLYISPDYYTLRKELDWINNELLKCMLTIQDKKNCVKKVFLKLQSKINFTNDTNIDLVMNWTLSLNCLALIDKDIHWLHEEEYGESNYSKFIALRDDTLMYEYVLSCSKIFDYCSEYIITLGSDLNGAEILRFSECCGECLRAIITIFKSRLNSHIHVSTDESVKWNSLIEKFMKNSCRIISLHLYKDIITQTAMFIVYLQWICRYFQVDINITDQGGLILTAILFILDNENISDSQLFSVGIHPYIVNHYKEFTIGSRFALFRGLLSVFDDESLIFSIDQYKLKSELNSSNITSIINTKSSSNCNLDNSYEIIKKTCSHSAGDHQIHGLHALEAYLTRLYSIIIPYESLKSKFQFLSTYLIKAWSHTHKQLNHLVPIIYQKLIDTIQFYQLKYNIVDRDIWKLLIYEALSRSPENRSRYQALTIVLPKVKANMFMETRPTIVDELVCNISTRDICVSVSSFIAVLLKSYVDELNTMDLNGIDDARKLWITPVIKSVCSFDVRIRINSVDYLIPEVLRLDSNCGFLMMENIRKVTDKNLQLWGLVNVCTYCRLNGLNGQEVVQEKLGSNLTCDELIESCISDDDELRLRAINLISTSQKTAAPLEIHELLILKKVLKYYLKSSHADHRHRVCSTIKAIVTRVSESYRVAARDIEKIKVKKNKIMEELSCVDNSEKASLESKIKDINITIKNFEKISDNSHDILEWIQHLLIENLYPGTTFDRELMALDITDTIIEAAGKNSPLLKGFFSDLMTNVLLNLLISSWDRTRHVASNLLTKFPYPLPNYSKKCHVKELLKWASKLAGSVRQRESDAGALTMKVIFTIYCLHLGWDITSDDTVTDELVIKPEDPRHSDVTLLLKEHLKFCQSNTPTENVYALDIDELLASSITVFCGRVDGEAVAVGALRKIDDSHAEIKSMHVRKLSRGKGYGSALIAGILNFAKENGFSRISLETGTSSDFASARALYKKFHFVDCPPFGYYKPSEISICMTLLSKDHIEIKCAHFLNYLCDSLQIRIVTLDKLLKQVDDILNLEKLHLYSEGDPALCHGILMAIRYCLDVAYENKILNCEVWHPLIHRILSLSTESLHLAMTVVAETPSDVPFAPVIGAYNTATPNPSMSMAASYINVNSVMGAGTEKDIIDEKGSEIQRAVVGAWLLVKEASALLASLVKISPPTKYSEEDKDSSGMKKWLENSELLSFTEIKNVGNIILDALGRLKHMGAIAEAHSALQIICECLLRHGERSPQLCRLPSMWLNEILNRLKNERQVFILRRSAGFAYSFLSILRAEPANALPLLLKTAMSTLLHFIECNLDDIVENASTRLYSTTSEEIIELKGSWRGCVHALNVLRLILIDGSLGKELESYIGRSTQLAVLGFSSTKWAVRNSSMMVFSAVIQRAVNHDKNRGGFITVSDFFNRYPTLFPFLLSELGTITNYKVILENDWPVNVEISDSSQEKSEENIRSANEGGIHPSLYPILLLLAKLRSAIFREDENDDSTTDYSKDVCGRMNLDIFIPLIMTCRKHTFQKVREMTAKAFIPFVPIEEIAISAAKILSELKENITSNDLHGSLLLVEGILSNLSSHIESTKLQTVRIKILDEIGNFVNPALIRVEVLVRSRNCPPISIVFLRILKSLISLTKSPRVLELLYTYCTNASKSNSNITNITNGVKPFEPLLLKEAFHTLFVITIEKELSFISFESNSHLINSTQLLSCLTHKMSEVREGILIGCLQCINCDDSIHISDSKKYYLLQMNNFFCSHDNISRILIGACNEVEPDILQLFFDFLCCFVRSNSFRSLSLESIQLFLDSWNNLSKLIFREKEIISTTTAASSAIELLGWIISRLVDDDNSVLINELNLYQLKNWLDILEKACSEENPNNIRESVARSIKLSNILPAISKYTVHCKEKSNDNLSTYDKELSYIACKLWITALTLMQDDDDDVRCIMNQATFPALHFCNNSIENSINILSVGTYTLELMVNNIASSLIYNILSNSGNKVSDGLELILKDLFIKSGNIKQLKSVDKELDKIFQAEQWNVYIENITYTKIISKAIGKALEILNINHNSYLKDIIFIIINRTKEILLDFHDLSKNDEWIGGILLQKDTFSVMYSTLYTIQEIMMYINEDDMNYIKSLCEKIKPFTLNSHPLIDDILKNILSIK